MRKLQLTAVRNLQRISAVALLTLAFAVAVHAAIAHSSSISSPQANSNVNTTQTISVTCGPSLSNAVMVVWVVSYGSTAGDRNVTDVTYKGTGFTSVVEVSNGSANGRLEGWRLTNPNCDGSSGNLVITMGGNCSQVYTGWSVYTGVDQTTPVEASNTNTGGFNTSANISCTTVSSNALLVSAVGHQQGSGAATAASSQTVRFSGDSATQEFAKIASGDRVIASPGSSAGNWTLPAGDNWQTACMVLKEAAASPTGRRRAAIIN